MASTNLLFLRGTVGAAPKAFKTIAKVSVCTDSIHDDPLGAKVKSQDWVTVTILNPKSAAWVLKNIKKGDKIYAECRVSEGSYEAKDGTKVYTTNINANVFELIHPAPPKADTDA